MRKYYYASGVRVATPALAPEHSAGANVRAGGLTYNPLGDHPRSRREQALGGANVTANSSGVQINKLPYRPWGETRVTTGTTPTTWRFTGQRQDCRRRTIGLYYYGARPYDPKLVHRSVSAPGVRNRGFSRVLRAEPG